MWRFDLTDLTWTWVTGSNLTNDAGNMGTMGVADPANAPGARQVAGYAFDHVNRQLWMYGGDNINATGALLKAGSPQFHTPNLVLK